MSTVLCNFDLTEWVIKAFDAQPIESTQDAQDQLIQFIKDRERVRLTEEGYPHDIVIAVQSATNGLLTAQTKARVNALTHLQKNSDFAELIAIHKRVVNLLKDAEASVQPVDPDLFEDASERTLFSTVSEVVSKRVQDFVSHETFLRPLQACSA